MNILWLMVNGGIKHCIPFVDRYPKDTKTYAIMNTKPEESVQKDEESDADGSEETKAETSVQVS